MTAASDKEPFLVRCPFITPCDCRTPTLSTLISYQGGHFSIYYSTLLLSICRRLAQQVSGRRAVGYTTSLPNAVSEWAKNRGDLRLLLAALRIYMIEQ
jgi:hypothetical protein